MKLNTIQLMKLLAGRWELLYKLGDAAQKLSDAATDTMVERWEILKPVGDDLAPALDELFGSTKIAALSTGGLMQTEAELEAELIAGVQSYEDGLFVLAADDAPRSRFDGHRLRAGLKLFQELAPLLTTIGPLLVPLLTGGK